MNSYKTTRIFTVIMIFLLISSMMITSTDAVNVTSDLKHIQTSSTILAENGTLYALISYIPKTASHGAEILYTTAPDKIYITHILNNSLTYSNKLLLNNQTANATIVGVQYVSNYSHAEAVAIYDSIGDIYIYSLNTTQQLMHKTVGIPAHSFPMPQSLGYFTHNATNLLFVLNATGVITINLSNNNTYFSRIAHPISVSCAKNMVFVGAGNNTYGALKILNLSTLEWHSVITLKVGVSAIVAQNNTLYAGLLNGTVAVVNLTTLQISTYWKFGQSAILKLAMLNYSKLIIAMFGKIIIKDVSAGNVILNRTYPELNDFTTDGKSLLFLTLGNIYNPENETISDLLILKMPQFVIIYRTYGYEFLARTYATADNGKKLVILSKYGTLFVYNPVLDKNDYISNTTYFNASALYVSGSIFYVGTDKKLIAFDYTSLNSKWNASVPGGVSALAVNNNGSTIVVANNTGAIYVFKNHTLAWINNNLKYSANSFISLHFVTADLFVIMITNRHNQSTLSLFSDNNVTMWTKSFNTTTASMTVWTVKGISYISVVMHTSMADVVYIYNLYGKLVKLLLNTAQLGAQRVFNIGVYKNYFVLSAGSKLIFFNKTTLNYSHTAELIYSFSNKYFNTLPLLMLNITNHTYLVQCNLGQLIGIRTYTTYILPTIMITSPTYGAVINVSTKIVHITGTAYVTDGTIKYVEISINNSTWQRAVGTTHWHFNWNIQTLPVGNYTILARAFDGLNYSYSMIRVSIYSPNILHKKPYTISFTLILELILSIISLVLIVTGVLLYSYKEKKKKEDLELVYRRTRYK